MKLDIEAFKKRKELLSELEKDTIAYIAKNNKNSQWISNQRLIMLNTTAAKLEKNGEDILECSAVFSIDHLNATVTIPFSNNAYDVTYDRGPHGVNVKIAIRNENNTTEIFDTIHTPDGWKNLDKLSVTMIEEICCKLPDITERNMIDALEAKIMDIENKQRLAYNEEREKDISLTSQIQTLARVDKIVKVKSNASLESEEEELEL